MPLTYVDVHKTDYKTLQEMTRITPAQPCGGTSNPCWFQFSYEFRAGVSQNDCLGITWDGAFLWFSTQGHAAAAEGPRIIKIDPRTGTILEIIAVSLPGGSGVSIHDIAWTGAGFVLMCIVGTTRTLEYIDKSGQWIRTIATGLPALVRGIEFVDGRIHTFHINAGTYHRTYDFHTGVIVNDVVTSSPYTTFPIGVTWLGHALLSKRLVTGNKMALEVTDINATYSANLVVRADASRTYWNACTIEKRPIVFDGAFLWEFSTTLLA